MVGHLAYSNYQAARLSGSNPKMEAMSPEDFVPMWKVQEADDEVEEIPVEATQKRLLTKVLGVFGLQPKR